ncbi:hypothetical protein GCM10007921_33990 [Tritonibacter mobilis]|jgi:hypothetical protein|nr:hypothetical protein GCM10007921_33990 [Tritonibacter mobilis]
MRLSKLEKGPYHQALKSNTYAMAMDINAYFYLAALSFLGAATISVEFHTAANHPPRVRMH